MQIKDEVAVEPREVASAVKPDLPGVGAGAVILIGAWIGLIAGFGDVGILVVNRRLIFRDFYHLGADFPWIVPLGRDGHGTCARALDRLVREDSRVGTAGCAGAAAFVDRVS